MYRITFLSLTGEYPSLLEAMEAYQMLAGFVPCHQMIKVEQATNDCGFEQFDAEAFLDGMAQLLGVER